MLIVGDIGYSEEELLGLNADRRLKLAEITAFGISVSREESDRVLAPLLKQTQDRALLDNLLHIVLWKHFLSVKGTSVLITQPIRHLN